MTGTSSPAPGAVGAADAHLLDIREVCRSFSSNGERVDALRDVSFSIAAGETVGVLGRNGAGKTTLIKVVSTLLLPTSGSVRIDGFDVTRDVREARSRLSVVLGGDRGLYSRLTATQNVEFMAAISGVDRHHLRTRIRDALERVGLAHAANRRVETFSRGMRQRLHLAIGLLTTPRLLLLDEPTSGLDPIEAQRLRDEVSELGRQGIGILITSHNLLDIERLASRVVVLEHGQVTHDLPLPELVRSGGAVARVVLRGRGTPPVAHELVIDSDSLVVHEIETADGGWTLTATIRSWSREALTSFADLVSGDVTECTVAPAGLEDVFVNLGAGVRPHQPGS